MMPVEEEARRRSNDRCETSHRSASPDDDEATHDDREWDNESKDLPRRCKLSVDYFRFDLTRSHERLL